MVVDTGQDDTGQYGGCGNSIWVGWVRVKLPWLPLFECERCNPYVKVDSCRFAYKPPKSLGGNQVELREEQTSGPYVHEKMTAVRHLPIFKGLGFMV